MDNQRKRVEAFLQLATEELGVAIGIVEEAPRQCAYLLQQAAEKMARAILTAADVQFGPGHNLGQMAGVLPENHPWKEKIRSLNKHSPAVTRYRYPTPEGRLLEPPSSRTLAQDVRELTDLLEEARRFLARKR
jgi:HEPN domain-containing protein